MAIYRLSAKIIKRSEGRCVVAAAAYRAGENLLDEAAGLYCAYGNRKGVAHKEIMLPEGAPEWMGDRARLWNDIERVERRKDSQLAREIQLALPVELSLDAQLVCLKKFIQEEFVALGMVADVAVHNNDQSNPHAHVLLTMRSVSEGGFGPKVTGWNQKALLYQWREEWARHVNLALEREGYISRIDHRSYADRGIDLLPSVKLGTSFGADDTGRRWYHDGREMVEIKLEEQARRSSRNFRKLNQHPEQIIEILTAQKAVVREEEIAKFVLRFAGNQAQYDGLMAKVMGHQSLVSLGLDESGRRLFSSKELLEKERQLLGAARNLHDGGGYLVAEDFLKQAEGAGQFELGQEQKSVLQTLCGNRRLVMVEGVAGAGKSYLLGRAREAWESQGFRVLGTALSGKAAEGLATEAGIPSSTLHSLEGQWERGEGRLGFGDVLVIDEVGMVGTRQLCRVVSYAESQGAKVVMVGDVEQLQAIEAGSPFRMLSQEVGSVRLSEVRRQSFRWMREATLQLSVGQTAEALKAYDSDGWVKLHADKEAALGAVISSWNQTRLSHPHETQMMLAYRRGDVEALNQKAREILYGQGQLQNETKVKTAQGSRVFAPGDRVYFLKNDRQLGVKNGTLGTIEGLSCGLMTVRLDGADKVSLTFDLKEYNHLDHGYAATIHKAQGVTVDSVEVLGSGWYFDRHATYVAMSRHRQTATLHASKEEFNTKEDLFDSLSKEGRKHNLVDFETSADVQGQVRGFKKAFYRIQGEAMGMGEFEKLTELMGVARDALSRRGIDLDATGIGEAAAQAEAQLQKLQRKPSLKQGAEVLSGVWVSIRRMQEAVGLETESVVSEEVDQLTSLKALKAEEGLILEVIQNPVRPPKDWDEDKRDLEQSKGVMRRVRAQEALKEVRSKITEVKQAKLFIEDAAHFMGRLPESMELEDFRATEYVLSQTCQKFLSVGFEPSPQTQSQLADFQKAMDLLLKGPTLQKAAVALCEAKATLFRMQHGFGIQAPSVLPKELQNAQDPKELRQFFKSLGDVKYPSRAALKEDSLESCALIGKWYRAQQQQEELCERLGFTSQPDRKPPHVSEPEKERDLGRGFREL